MTPTLQEFLNAFEKASKSGDDFSGNPMDWSVTRGVLAVLKIEREACAKIADATPNSSGAAACIAAEIRARSNEH